MAHSQSGEPLVEDAANNCSASGPGWVQLTTVLIQFLLGRPELYGLPSSTPFLSLGETVYHEPSPPADMPPACAGVLSETLNMQENENRTRREHGHRLRQVADRTRDLEAVSPPKNSQPDWLRFPVLAQTHELNRRLSSRRARRLGVMPGYPRPLSKLPGCRAALLLPLHSTDTQSVDREGSAAAREVGDLEWSGEVSRSCPPSVDRYASHCSLKSLLLPVIVQVRRYDESSR